MTEFDKGGKQCRGQVVDAEVADILKTFQRVGLSGPREPGDDDEPRRAGWIAWSDLRQRTTFDSSPLTSEITDG